jgi:hypothetical protein
MSSIKLQRLNMDSSWLLNWGETILVIDPWLIGSEVDGFKWLNEQWHIKDPVAVNEISHYDGILISNPYSDHCHLDTLRKLNVNVPIVATEATCKRIKKEWKERQTTSIGYLNQNNFTTFKNLKIAALKPAGKIIDPIYHSLLICNGNDAIFYSAHGIPLTGEQLTMLKPFNIKLLATTFTWFKLPKIMGGLVNPGYEAALKLADQLQAQYIINTHDEPKIAKGLVNTLSKVKYRNADAVNDKRVVDMNDYNQKEFI